MIAAPTTKPITSKAFKAKLMAKEKVVRASRNVPTLTGDQVALYDVNTAADGFTLANAAKLY